jgi:threonine 3-dehydrogenase
MSRISESDDPATTPRARKSSKKSVEVGKPVRGAAVSTDAGKARSRGKQPALEPEMWALTYDYKEDPWDRTRGFRRTRMPTPVLDEDSNPLDASAVIVKVMYTGVCGSDAGIWFRTSFKEMIRDSLRQEGKTTRIIGHEVFGEVVRAGTVAEARYGIKKGDLVSAESHIVCGKCHQCLIGQTHVCTDERILGISYDGGFAEYIKLPARVLWRTNTRKIRKEVAAIQEPFGNAVHACSAVDLRGKSVAVFGCGAIGQFTIMIARALGAAKIIGIEPDPRKAKIALEIGADEVVQFTPRTKGNNTWKADRDVVERVVEFSGIDGIEVSMEMAGYNSSVNNALQSVRRGGEVVLFGIRSGDFKIEDFSHLIVKGITIRNIIGRRMFETWEMTKNLLETKENRIQSKIWNVMLNKGRGTIIDAAKFDPDVFEKKIQTHPKILIRWSK